MRYVGSKRRIAKKLWAIMREEAQSRRYYIEPFAGGFNMLTEVKHNHVIASDFNEGLINMWKAVLFEGWIPPNTVTEKQYKELLKQEEETPLKTFARYACSWGGVGSKTSGYARDGGRNKSNYALRAKTVLKRQAKAMLNNIDRIDIKVKSYDESIYGCFSDCFIYCDPPYRSADYYVTDSFDNDRFEDWAVYVAKQGAIVYVSEYKIDRPEFKLVWEHDISSSMSWSDRQERRTEKLYKVIV